MYMHQIADLRAPGEAAAEPAALVFRAVLRGAAHVVWRNRRVRLDEDAWLVLDGREPVMLQADAERGADVFCIGVGAGERDAALGDACARAAAAAGASGGSGLCFADHLRPMSGPTGQRLFAMAEARAAGRPPARTERLALVRDAAFEELELRRRALRLTCAKPETREELLRRILLAADFIASHHDEPISLDEMARAASLSRFHFVRIFRLIHGETPHAFLLKKRTAVARRHLAVGGACREAASRAGFGSRSALFRNLRKSSRPGAAPLAARCEPCSLSA